MLPIPPRASITTTLFCFSLLLSSSMQSSPSSSASAAPRRSLPPHPRRLLELDRVGDGRCTAADITILQGPANPLPDGIPTFTVQIFNGCSASAAAAAKLTAAAECVPRLSRIHVSCGWWATAKLVNPAVFRRLRFDDCLVNDGKPLDPGQLLTFQYANSFPYPLAVKSVASTLSCT